MALHKKSYWKSITEVLFERGYHVWSQQCKDKINDFNTRFKKLEHTYQWYEHEVFKR